MAASETWHRRFPGGIDLFVHLTPKSGRDAIDGPKPGAGDTIHLGVRVRAVAANGSANAALVALIARNAGIARSRVAIVSGHAARLKVVRIECEPAETPGIVSAFGG